MKPILAIVIVFGLASLGMGVYFVKRAQVTQTQIQAQANSVALRDLVTNCDLWYLPDCTSYSGAKEELVEVPRETERLVRTHASPSVMQYSEPVSDLLYANLGKLPLLPVQTYYTPDQIIARIAIASRINHRLLLTLFALQGSSAWNGESLVSNPLGRKELSFAQQFASVARELQSIFTAESLQPTTAITVGKTTYTLDPSMVHAHSRTMYIYLSRTSDPEKFEKIVKPDYSTPGTFANVWESLR